MTSVLKRMLNESSDDTEKSALRFALQAIICFSKLEADVNRLNRILDTQWAILWSPEPGPKRLELFESGIDGQRFEAETGGDLMPLSAMTWHANSRDPTD